MFLAGLDPHSNWNLISFVVFAGAMFWGVTNIRDRQLEGIMSYGKAFGVGFWIAVFAAVLAAIYSYFYLKYLDPSVLQNAVSIAEDKILSSNPNISDADLEKALSFAKLFSNPVFSSVWALVANIFAGTIFSLIIAIFAKREDKTIA